MRSEIWEFDRIRDADGKREILLARVEAVMPTEEYVPLNCFVKADAFRQLLPPIRVDRKHLLHGQNTTGIFLGFSYVNRHVPRINT